MATSTPTGRRLWLRIIAGAVLLVALLCVSFAIFVPAKPKYGGLITFAPGTTYAQALRTVTDLGLQTILPCFGGPQRAAQASVIWTAVGERDVFAQAHRLWIGNTALALPYWPGRLRLAPGVTDVDTGEHTFACPFIQAADPAHDTLALSQDRTGDYVHATFDQNVTYDDALAFVSNYGLRLADPCAERSWTAGKLPWASAGQESGFATSHALTVATTNYGATTWRDQLQAPSAQAVVSRVESPISIHC